MSFELRNRVADIEDEIYRMNEAITDILAQLATLVPPVKETPKTSQKGKK